MRYQGLLATVVLYALRLQQWGEDGLASSCSFPKYEGPCWTLLCGVSLQSFRLQLAL